MVEGRAANSPGSLVIIGGREDRDGDMDILREVAGRARGGPLVVITLASSVGEELFRDYQTAFARFDVRCLPLPILRRKEALDLARCAPLVDAAGVFFTGGDQLKLTSELGGTPAADMIRALYLRGGVVAGTSAGASVLGQIMPVSGAQDDSARVRDQLRLVPGLGLVPDVIVDQHFAQRGRLGRIIGAVAQNPGMLGIGIDENTALLFDRPQLFSVIGAGAVTIADGRTVTHSNVNDADSDHAMSVFDLRLHIPERG